MTITHWPADNAVCEGRDWPECATCNRKAGYDFVLPLNRDRQSFTQGGRYDNPDLCGSYWQMEKAA